MRSLPARRLTPTLLATYRRAWLARIHTVRDVVLHMVEETARHAGHLDIARELLDGRTGLGPADHTHSHTAIGFMCLGFVKVVWPHWPSRILAPLRWVSVVARAD
jgi:Protein of unknown function (DUF664)